MAKELDDGFTAVPVVPALAEGVGLGLFFRGSLTIILSSALLKVELNFFGT